MVRPKGSIVCAGVTGSDKPTTILTDEIVFNEIRFQGVLGSSFEAVESAIKLVESRKYPVEKMVTHRFALREADKAVRSVAGEVPGISPLKAVIVPWA